MFSSSFVDQPADKISENLVHILATIDARISSLEQPLGIQILVDQEIKPTKYWENYRETFQTLLYEWYEYLDVLRFLTFLSSLRSDMVEQLGLREIDFPEPTFSNNNPLEDFLRDTTDHSLEEYENGDIEIEPQLMKEAISLLKWCIYPPAIVMVIIILLSVLSGIMT
jgi:hypothetical protein